MGSDSDVGAKCAQGRGGRVSSQCILYTIFILNPLNTIKNKIKFKSWIKRKHIENTIQVVIK